MTDITATQITRFEEAKRRFEQFQIVKPQEFGMRPTLNEVEIKFLDSMLASVKLHVVLDYIAASTFEAADAVGHPSNTHASESDCEAGMWLAQQAATISAAALFCKTWEPGK